MIEEKRFSSLKKEDKEYKDDFIPGLGGKVYIMANDILFYKDLYLIGCINSVSERFTHEELVWMANKLKRKGTWRFRVLNHKLIPAADSEKFFKDYKDDQIKLFLFWKNSLFDTRDIYLRFKDRIPVKNYTDIIGVNTLLSTCTTFASTISGQNPNLIWVFEDQIELVILKSIFASKEFIPLKASRMLYINKMHDEILNDTEKCTAIFNAFYNMEKIVLPDIKDKFINVFFNNSAMNYHTLKFVDDYINKQIENLDPVEKAKVQETNFVDSIIEIL